jgi:hypothetical protein
MAVIQVLGEQVGEAAAAERAVCYSHVDMRGAVAQGSNFGVEFAFEPRIVVRVQFGACPARRASSVFGKRGPESCRSATTRNRNEGVPYIRTECAFVTPSSRLGRRVAKGA